MKFNFTIHGRKHEIVFEKADQKAESVPDEYPGIKPEFYYSYSVSGEEYSHSGTIGLTQKSCARFMNEIHPKPVIIKDFLNNLYIKAVRQRLENGSLPEFYIIEKEEMEELLNLLAV